MLEQDSRIWEEVGVDNGGLLEVTEQPAGGMPSMREEVELAAISGSGIRQAFRLRLEFSFFHP